MHASETTPCARVNACAAFSVAPVHRGAAAASSYHLMPTQVLPATSRQRQLEPGRPHPESRARSRSTPSGGTASASCKPRSPTCSSTWPRRAPVPCISSTTTACMPWRRRARAGKPFPNLPTTAGNGVAWNATSPRPSRRPPRHHYRPVCVLGDVVVTAVAEYMRALALGQRPVTGEGAHANRTDRALAINLMAPWTGALRLITAPQRRTGLRRAR